ncbi:MAG TPA: zinc-binding dehydrogenase [Acidimicrobiia bacterium]|nr:zinc-binding dehydrogenase [Acidimicrobiia bacterium]
MRALVFGVEPGADVAPAPDPAGLGPDDDHAQRLLRHLARTPMALQDLADPEPLGPDWVVLRTRLTGICGSDSKQVFMDTGGDTSDFSMTAFISFPQVLGHEVVGTVERVGPDARGVEPGQRVVLQCWLSCAPRGITPLCPACATGDYSQCWSFTDGRITPGIHVGNSSDGTGGFAELLPAHDSMAIPIPDEISDEVAVLADPFAVALHSITRAAPPEHGKVIVWGAGALGTSAVAILRALYPTVDVAVVARTAAQQATAAKMGAHVVIPSEQDGETLVRALAEFSGGVLRTPWQGLPIAHPGFVDRCYDTIGSPQTLELALRVMAARGVISVTGVYAAGRFEWSPWYFKEVSIVGSNAFGVEEVDGVRKHAIEHYLDLVRDGRVDISPMLTHTFRLDEWRDAFTTLARQDRTGAIKVAFDFR